MIYFFKAITLKEERIWSSAAEGDVIKSMNQVQHIKNQLLLRRINLLFWKIKVRQRNDVNFRRGVVATDSEEDKRQILKQDAVKCPDKVRHSSRAGCSIQLCSLLLAHFLLTPG